MAQPTALYTDLYELTMAQAYMAEGMEATAEFEIFFRKLPPQRRYAVACGLSDCLDFLERWRFSEEDITYLRGLGTFSEAFLERLPALRFTGDVWAVPEGSVVFPNEPVLRVAAPLPVAQIVETALLNEIHFQSVIASKASRVIDAAAGRPVMDFGARRAHGDDAAMKLARLTFLAGASGTSHVRAGRHYGIPVLGTMAHSYIQAHGDEARAFAAFVREFPETTLLVDTYDTLRGVDRVIELARQLGEDFRVRAVRLDSGDMDALARQAREQLDAAGLSSMKIVASSSLDEYEISRLVASGAPIDGFGVGTQWAVSADCPELDFAYKLVSYDGEPRMKLSSGKATLPGAKQVFREVEGGRWRRDTIACADEKLLGEPLLQAVMRGGRRLPGVTPGLDRLRARLQEQLALLPPVLRDFDTEPVEWPVEVSETLLALQDSLIRNYE